MQAQQKRQLVGSSSAKSGNPEKGARRSERAALLPTAFGELGQEFIFDE
jgi:hypothetical protein